MLETKLFEVRDSGTFIVVMATRLIPIWDNQSLRTGLFTNGVNTNPGKEAWLLHRVGLGHPDSYQILMSKIESGESSLDSEYWTRESPLSRGTRTLTMAHRYIEQTFSQLKSGDLIDVQFIIGETTEPKVSEMKL
jgi:hypothetical protein